MIIGTFRERWRPHVRGRLALPRLQVRTTVNFQVDTGSDITLLHPPDLRQTDIRAEQLRGASGTAGIGGATDTFREPAILYFTDVDSITEYSYRLDIYIASPDAYNNDFPSLLGMDVLSCWYTECDPTNDMLRFTVRRTL